MKASVNDPVNIGNPHEMSLLDLAKRIIRLTGSRSEIVFRPLPVDDPKVRQPDISRARTQLALGADGRHRRGPAPHDRLVPEEDPPVRVLVTGGAGFIGSHVVDRLIGDGHDGDRGRQPEHRPASPNVNRAASFRSVISAARGSTRWSPRPGPRPWSTWRPRPRWPARSSTRVFDASVNVVGTLVLLEASRRAGVRRVVYTSTGGAAYGDTDVLPTPEDHPMRATSPYGVSKVAAERYLECWAGLTGGRRCRCAWPTSTAPARTRWARPASSPSSASACCGGALRGERRRRTDAGLRLRRGRGRRGRPGAVPARRHGSGRTSAPASRRR